MEIDIDKFNGKTIYFELLNSANNFEKEAGRFPSYFMMSQVKFDLLKKYVESCGILIYAFDRFKNTFQGTPIIIKEETLILDE